jgi:hypothetical protein
MNSYRAYRWNYEDHLGDFAEFIVTLNGDVILAIQFDGNLGDCRSFGGFDKIDENNSYWKRIE